MSGLGRPGRALLRTGLAAATAVVAVAVLASSQPWDLGRDLQLLRGTGWVACAALLLSLATTPLARLGRWLWPGHPAFSPAAWMAYRRAWGVVAALAAGLHGAVALSTYLWTSWRAVLEEPYLRSGLVALSILAALLATSFPRLLAPFGVVGWKELHRLAYVAAFLVLHHLLLSPFAPRGVTLVLFGLAALLAPLRFIPTRRARPG